MRIVSVSEEFLTLCTSVDKELLLKRGRPCVVLVHLRYKGMRYDFAVPMRSNIAPNTPKNQYFTLPPRPATKPHYRHGLHYIKMFPIQKKYQEKFRVEGNSYYENLVRILEKEKKRIVRECQEYLERYEQEGKPRFAVDIDNIIEILSL